MWYQREPKGIHKTNKSAVSPEWAKIEYFSFIHLKMRSNIRHFSSILLFFQAIREVFMEFCSNSTIHAVKYFTEPNRHLSERWISRTKHLFSVEIQRNRFEIFDNLNIRLWWMGAFGLSVLLCGLSIQNILINWNENPVSMSFTEKPVPISTIPFPTVILCSETKTNSSKLNVTSAYDLLRGSWAYLQEIE